MNRLTKFLSITNLFYEHIVVDMSGCWVSPEDGYCMSGDILQWTK
jgi:hypothetical protein